LSGAIRLLEPLASQPEASPALKSSIARIYLQAGNIPAAKEVFAKVEADETVDEPMKRMNRALLAITEGDWADATENFRAILEKDSDDYVVRFKSVFGYRFLFWSVAP
jgi:thioredoxin-like negative regulator of GroEL